MYKFVLSNSYGTPNAGDEAILLAMVNNIKNNFSKCSIIILSYYPTETAKKYKTEAVQSGIFRGLYKTIKAIAQADVLIVGGGGIIQDDSSTVNLIFHLSRILIAKIFRVKVMCYAVGVSVNTKIGKLLCRFVLNKVNLITVRDDNSAKCLQDVGINKPQVVITGDPAIALVSCSQERADEILDQAKISQSQGPSIAVCLRPWFFPKHSWVPVKYILKFDIYKKKDKGFFKRFFETIAYTLDKLIKDLDAQIIFVPFWLEQDFKIARLVADKMRNKQSIRIISRKYTSQETLGIINRMDLVLGMRLHSLIFAVISEIPFIGINYLGKVRGFAKTIGQEDYVLEISEVKGDCLLKAVCDAWGKRTIIRKQLIGKKSELAVKAANNIPLLKNLLNS